MVITRPASAGSLFWPSMLTALPLFFSFQPLVFCLPVTAVTDEVIHNAYNGSCHQ